VTVVVDASVVVAALVDDGSAGEWSAGALRGRRSVAAPQLLAFEVANVLRRLATAGRLVDEVASLAHQDLLRLDLVLWPYLPLAEEAWRARGSVSVYDASYVALARLLGAPLLTLDERLARTAAGLCDIRTPGLSRPAG
jgi:predicted nucleic acid-binding protein